MNKLIFLFVSFYFISFVVISQGLICENFQTEVQFENWSTQNITSGVSSSWHWGEEFAAENIYLAHHSYVPTSDNFNDWLISPSYDLSSMDSAGLTFTEYIGWIADAEEHNVYYSTNYTSDVNSATWNLLYSDINTDADNTFIQRGPFELPEGSNIVIAFQYIGTNASNWWVDDICIQSYGEDYCEMPNITSWSMTSDGVEIDGENSENISGYQIEYSSSIFVPGDGSSSIYEFDTLPHIFTGLEVNSTYFFSIRSLCESGNFSEWYDNGYDGPDEWSTTSFICENEQNCSLGDGINGILLEDISNLNSGCSENGYGNFINLSTDLVQGESYYVSVSTTYTNQFVRSWIDFNNDYEFTQDELIIDNIFISTPSTQNIEILIPSDAILGNHIIRFIASWNEEVGDACDTSLYGETEDYSVNIIEFLGIENSNIFRLDIYPNPVNSDFITIKTTIDGTRFIEFFDINGRRVFSTITQKDNLDVSNFKSGFYFIKVKIDNKIITSKLIIE